MNKFTTSLCAMAVLTCALYLPGARAACDLSFQEIRQSNQRPYSVFHPGTNVIDLHVTIRAEQCEDVSFSFDSSNDQTLIGPSDGILYQVKTVSGANVEVNGVTRVPRRALASSQSSRVLVIRSFLKPGSFVAPGLYSDELAITAYSENAAVAQTKATLALQVSPEADIQFRGAGAGGYSSKAGGSLNFGRLRAGKERSAFLFVRSNVNYALSLSSENNGSLRHVSEVGESARIPYMAWLDDQLLDLASRTTVRHGSMTPVFLSRPHRFTARIGDVRGKVAGDYRDVVLVEVVFLE